MDMTTDMLKEYKIGVLAGGSSSEREISLKSGKAVFGALSGAGLDVMFIDIREDDFAVTVKHSGIDIAFIALHGKFGEDGTVQRMLSEQKILYTGSGPEASRIALDKVESKKRFREKGLDIPEYRVVEFGDDLDPEDVWIPCVVKPRHEGSSIGLSVVRSKEDLHGAVDRALTYGDKVLVENFIDGREVTVGILGGEALPVVEIKPAGGCYDFNAKYESGETEYIVPARIDKVYFERAQKTALGAHDALGCEEFSRVDMRLSPEGKVFVLEVNTIPGLTERSLLPMAAAASGLDFTGLCVKILLGAMEKKQKE